MKKIYICHTVYHVYIAMMKTYGKYNSDIVLIDTIPNFESLSVNIEKVDIFKSVIILDRELVFGKRIRTFLGNYINNRLRFIRIKKKLSFFYRYDEIYIFNDYSEIGDFLEKAGIKYHLLEDGLDIFKQFDVYEDIGYGKKLKRIMYKLFEIPYSVGMNKNCIDIEVNNSQNLRSALLHPIKECNRKQMLELIPRDYINKMISAFGAKPFPLSSNNLLLLTQILKEILVVNSDKEQIELYRNALKEYKDRYNIYIKPHPRDYIDYSDLEKEFGAVCLDKNIPVEIYSLLPNMYFNIILTYSSTAVNANRFGGVVVRLDNCI